MSFKESIQELRKVSKKRNFTQTVDLIVNVKNIDLRKPENRINKETVLPAGRGKDLRIGVISDSYEGENRISMDELREISKNKRKAKEFVRSYDFFAADVKYMAEIGKMLGRYMGPLGKVPKPIPPGVPADRIIERLKNTVRVVLKTNPVIQVPIGTESMSDEDLEKNYNAVMDFIVQNLPKGKSNIKSAYIKMTMSKPVMVN